jgi:YHS domain-containing protein
MLKKVGLFVLVLVAAAVVVSAAMAEETKVTVVKETTKEAAVAPVAVNNTICPVTGATIEKLGENTIEYNGKVYNLCMAGCKEEFMKDPAMYAAKAEASVKPVEKTVTTETTTTTTEASAEKM